jgi:hypothetical protein
VSIDSSDKAISDPRFECPRRARLTLMTVNLRN